MSKKQENEKCTCHSEEQECNCKQEQKDNIENWVSELYWFSADSYIPKIMQKIILILK